MPAVTDRAPRRHDPEASRAAILDAAERIFLERGFAGASMSEIAKASGVTKSLIHHHFGSKEALWNEVKKIRFSVYYDQQMRLIGNAQIEPEMLNASMRMYFRFLRDNPQVSRMFWWMLLEGGHQDNEMVDELRTVGVERIAVAQEQGLLRKDIPASFMLVMMLGLVHAWFNEPACSSLRPELAEDYLEAACKVFAAGIVAG